jgi:hypothetical protein
MVTRGSWWIGTLWLSGTTSQNRPACGGGWMAMTARCRPIGSSWSLAQATTPVPYTATGPDMFEALVRLRRQLEPDGLRVAVQGSRRDTYPSGMARDMGGGTKVYVMRPGLPARPEDLVEALDDAPLDQMATVAEQQAFFDAWLAEPGKQ